LFVLQADWLSDLQIKKLELQLISLFQKGEVVILKWIEWLKEKSLHYLDLPLELEEIKSSKPEQITEKQAKKSNEFLQNKILSSSSSNPRITITHGESVTDRKSKFVAHIAEIHSLNDVNEVLDQLKQNKKIANATHNVYAFRFEIEKCKGKITLVEDRDDDGETGAGDKLLYMLQMLNAVNIIVIVTRWYGGINLGNDRFKYIVNLGQQLVKQHIEIKGSIVGSKINEANHSRK